MRKKHCHNLEDIKKMVSRQLPDIAMRLGELGQEREVLVADMRGSGEVAALKLRLEQVDFAIEEALDVVNRKLCDKLFSTELVAYGFPTPIKTRKIEIIPCDFWSFLRVNFKGNFAAGNKIKYVGLKFIIMAELPQKDQDEILALMDDSNVTDGLVGRPTIMPAIEEEMRRRAENGELISASLAEETKYLALWAKNNFPGKKTPKERSIENNVRMEYRQLVKKEGAVYANHPPR